MSSPQIQKNWLFVLLIPIPFLFYWYTCLPSIGLSDSGMYLSAIKRLKISPYVNCHNLTTLWGWPFQLLPFGDFAYRGNLSCVFAGGLAICTFFLTIYRLHQCLVTALICSSFLMVSHSIWWHCTTLTDYAMNTFLTTLAIYLFVQLHQTKHIKYLYTLFFLSGLVLFQHYLMGSLLIGSIAALLYKLFKHKESPWPLVWKSFVLFLIGLIPWLVSFWHYVNVKHSLSLAISGCMGGPFKKLYFKYPFWNGINDFFFLVCIQFPSIFIVPIALGLFFFLKKWKFSESSVGLIFTFLPVFYFELFTSTWAKFAQLISVFIILVFWASFAVYWMIHHSWIKKSLLSRCFLIIAVIFSLGWTIYFYAHLTQWAENPKSFWYRQYNSKYYENSPNIKNFLANPNKRNYHDIENFCNLVLTKLPAHSQFWDSDSRFYYQFKSYYQRHYHQRPDVDFQLFFSLGYPGFGADKNTFFQNIKHAYLNNENLFLCSTGHPMASLLSQIPDSQNYKFEKFPLNDKWWVYKLKTIQEENLVK